MTLKPRSWRWMEGRSVGKFACKIADQPSRSIKSTSYVDIPVLPVAVESPLTLGDRDMNKDRHRRPLQRRRKWIVILFCTIIDYSVVFPPQAMNIKRADWVASEKGILTTYVVVVKEELRCSLCCDSMKLHCMIN